MDLKKIAGYNLVILSIIILSISNGCHNTNNRNALEIINFVNPFIGTDSHGHTFPGATLPFSMVQLSPDTRTNGWDACAGYHYSDSSILGFSHTHLSGTGIGDYGDILFMPFTGNISLDAGEEGQVDSGYRSRFNKQTETASPGYYSVELTDYNIKAELTSTLRTGVHRYTYPEAEVAGILIDLTHTIHSHQNTLHEIKILNEYEIQGLKVTSGWAKKHLVYFYAKFSKPFDAQLFLNNQLQANVNELSGTAIKIKLNFRTKKDEIVIAKVGLSPVGYEGALNNLNLEADKLNFDAVKENAEIAWENQLSKVHIETEDLSKKKIFYTALYHAYIYPGIYSDADGSYRGMDQNPRHSDSLNYTVFSLWDTHRALHPFFTIAEPKFNQELIRSLLRKYNEGGILPMWELASNYTGTMIGSHAVSVIADAFMKGQRDFDTETALEAMINSVKFNSINKPDYVSEEVWGNLMPKAKFFDEKYGFIPCDLENYSVAKALEFSYNYWGIATMAHDMGKDSIATEYFEKSERYKTYFDKEVGFMRGKRQDGTWDVPFNPRYSSHSTTPYVEGNAWQWTWYAPHRVDGLIDLFGGKTNFAIKLDSLFTITSEVLGEDKSADITGLIGQYAHGNEPSHHIAYLYNYADQPWRTQELVTQILCDFYTDQPDGLCGNEDCGQMSAWYLLSSIGIYPVCPGDPKYSIGIPSFDKVEIKLEENKVFTVIAKNRTKTNPYVMEVFLNGVKLSEPFIYHKDIMNGSIVTFVMGSEKTIFWK